MTVRLKPALSSSCRCLGWSGAVIWVHLESHLPRRHGEHGQLQNQISSNEKNHSRGARIDLVLLGALGVLAVHASGLLRVSGFKWIFSTPGPHSHSSDTVRAPMRRV